jgi:hypothetical protein
MRSPTWTEPNAPLSMMVVTPEPASIVVLACVNSVNTSFA